MFPEEKVRVKLKMFIVFKNVIISSISSAFLKVFAGIFWIWLVFSLLQLRIKQHANYFKNYYFKKLESKKFPHTLLKSMS